MIGSPKRKRSPIEEKPNPAPPVKKEKSQEVQKREKEIHSEVKKEVKKSYFTKLGF